MLSLLDRNYEAQNHAGKGGSTPDTRPPVDFASLPEHILEDMASFLVFLSRYGLSHLKLVDLTPVIHMFFLLLSRSSPCTL